VLARFLPDGEQLSLARSLEELRAERGEPPILRLPQSRGTSLLAGDVNVRRGAR
jgi:hypothetical protein